MIETISRQFTKSAAEPARSLMPKRKATLIANPKTGPYKSRRGIPIEELADYLESLGVDVNLCLTSGPGDATRIAAATAGTGSADVIVAGGYGPINEAMQGIIGTKSRLAIIPRGTANVLAHELDIPFDAKRAAQLVARGNTRRIHLGVAIDDRSQVQRYFVLMAGIGLDASVVREVDPSLKKRIGKGAFWISGLSHLASWKPRTFTLEIDGKSYQATFAAIGKAATYGGQLAITPRAQIDSPEFEVCLIKSSSRLRYLRLLSHAMREGMPENNEDVLFLKTQKVKAIGDAPVQIDGELIGDLPMTFEIASESLDVIVP
jgi:YegS/Rv2252/BmrU family lipid kinase